MDQTKYQEVDANAICFTKEKYINTNLNTKALEKIIETQKQRILELEESLELSNREVNSSTRLLWGAAHSAGGELRINDLSMRVIDENCELQTHYDPANLVTVIKAGKR